MLKKILLYLAIMAGSVAFCLIFILVFLNGTQLSCVQQTDQSYNCKAQTLLLGKIPTINRSFERVTSAKTVVDGCSEGCSYRTEFVTADGKNIPLTEVYSDEGPVNKQTAEINYLLQSGRPSLEYYRQPIWWVAYLIGGLFLMEFFILTFTMGALAIRDFMSSRNKTQTR